MKIVIDARMSAPRWTGIGLYSRKLLEELQKLDDHNQYVVLLDHEQFQSWTPTAANFTKVLSPYRVYSLAEQIHLPRQLRKLKPDLVHFLHFNVPIFYRGRKVVTIHDITMADFDLSTGGGLDKLKYQVKRRASLMALKSAVKAEKIIVPSHATSEALINRFGPLVAPRIVVTPEAVDAPANLAARPIHTDPPTLLYVGTLYPFKNVGLLIQALAEVLKNHRTAQLVIVGNTPRFIDELKIQAIDAGIDEHVRFTGFVSHKELARLYADASVFLFPSLSEGFGLPPLEAMAAGVPVLASKASAMPEVLGDGAQYFDPKSAPDLAMQINKLLDSPDALAALQAKGYKRIKDFSWQRMAEQTLAVYEGR